MVNINTSKSSGSGADGIAADDPLMELSRIIGLQEPAREPVTNDEDLALDLERELLTTLDEEPLVEFVQADESVEAWRETLSSEITETGEPFSDTDLDFDFSEALEQEMQPSAFAEQAHAPMQEQPEYQPAAPQHYTSYDQAEPLSEPLSAQTSLEDELEALLSDGPGEPAPVQRPAGTFGYSLANYGSPGNAERSQPIAQQPDASAVVENVRTAEPALDEPVFDELDLDDASFGNALLQDAEADLSSASDEEPQGDSFTYDAETDKIFGLRGDPEVVAEADDAHDEADLTAYAASFDEAPAVEAVKDHVVEPVLAAEQYDDVQEEQSVELEWSEDDFALTDEVETAANEQVIAVAPLSSIDQPVEALPVVPHEWRMEDAASDISGSYFSAHEAASDAIPVFDDAETGAREEAVAALDEAFTGAGSDFSSLSLDLADLQLDATSDVAEPAPADIDPADLDAFAREFEAFHLPEDESSEIEAEPVAEQGWTIGETASDVPSQDAGWPSYAAEPEFGVQEQASGEVYAAAEEQVSDDHLFAGFADELNRSISTVQPQPPLETVSLDDAVEITGNIDIPEVEYLQNAPVAGDQLENDFAEVFTGVEDSQLVDSLPEPAPAAPAEAQENNFDDIFADVFGSEANSGQQQAGGYGGAVAAGAAIAAAGAVAGHYAGNASASNYGRRTGSHASEPDLDYDPDNIDDEDLVIPPDSAVYQNRPARSRGMMIAGALGCLAVVGIAGAFAYSWMGGGNSEPVVIHADNTPIKVQPENPGGKTVPNQDKAVYDSVAGTAADRPTQEKLVSNREEPIDLAAQIKTEERVDRQPADVAMVSPSAETNVMAPRRVQTVVVRPDGTIVQPDPVPAVPEASSVARPETRPEPGAAPIAAGVSEGELAGLEPINEEAGLDEGGEVAALPVDPSGTVTGATRSTTAPVRSVETQTFTPESTAAPAPKNIPVVPSRPANQPLTIVDRAAPANAAPAPTQVASAAAAGGYMVQVASQPSVEAARKSYANLSRRHANLIGGKGVDIQQAEIAGRGTFYRVRIPAGSKEDAINLCTRYKAAGGSCLVTR
ncbi:MAG: SPOR domain-containing protein [Phyllobacterium sp.]